jgi:hypothetical protein
VSTATAAAAAFNANTLDSLANSKDVGFNGEVDYTLRRDIRLGFTGNCGYEDIRHVGHSRLLGAGTSLNVQLLRNLNSYTYASYRAIEPASISEGGKEFIYGTRFNYRLHRQCSIYAGFDREDSWNGGKHPLLNTATFGVSARF